MTNPVSFIEANEALRKAEEAAADQTFGQSLRKIRAQNAVRLFRGVNRGVPSRPTVVHGLSRALVVAIDVYSRDAHESTKNYKEFIQSMKDWVEMQDSGDEDLICQICKVVLHVLGKLQDSRISLSDRVTALRSLRRELLPTSSISLALSFARLAVAADYYEGVLLQAVTHIERGNLSAARSMLVGEESSLLEMVEMARVIEANESKNKRCIRQFYHSAYTFGTLDRIQTEHNLYIAISEASQRMKIADGHWSAGQDAEADKVLHWAQLAQDEYRRVWTIITEKDIEMEGLVITRLARFHAIITKLSGQAHELYMQAVQLAATLSPQLPKGAWYKEATDAIQARRNAIAAAEAQKWQNRRKPIIERLAPELALLESEDRSGKNNAELCEYIFYTFPPKTDGTKVYREQVSSEGLSRAGLIKIISRYHPDRNGMFGDDWLFICEEIVKCLNRRASDLKRV